MTDDETKFIESLMREIRRASDDQCAVLDGKLAILDQRMVEADLYVSDQIETMITRAKLRQRDIVGHLEDLKSVVTREVSMESGANVDHETAAMAERLAPQESVRQVINDSYRVN